MEVMQMTQQEVRTRRAEIDARIAVCEASHKEAKKELEELQAVCGHPNEKEKPEYDFVSHRCPDCGVSYGTRR